MDKQERERLRALAQAATPGPDRAREYQRARRALLAGDSKLMDDYRNRYR